MKIYCILKFATLVESLKKTDRFDVLQISRQMYQYIQFLSKLAEIYNRWLHHIGKHSHEDFLKILKIDSFMSHFHEKWPEISHSGVVLLKTLKITHSQTQFILKARNLDSS